MSSWNAICNIPIDRSKKIIKLDLTRIFHTDSAEACEHLMDTASASNCSSGSMYTYSPASKCSSALPHQPSRPPRHDQYEICGLTVSVDTVFLLLWVMLLQNLIPKLQLRSNQLWSI
ncbi:MAG: hypothetical protein K9M81_06220 [Chthoniobacterales bacterium]|nr:hypothetical protein [Chthoniobacterales bacterium]